MPSGLTLPSVLLSSSGQANVLGAASRTSDLAAPSETSFSDVYSKQQRQRADDSPSRTDAASDRDTSRTERREAQSADRSDDARTQRSDRAERDDDGSTQKSAEQDDDAQPTKAESGKQSSDDKEIAAKGKALPKDDTNQDDPPDDDLGLDPLLMLGLADASATTDGATAPAQAAADDDSGEGDDGDPLAGLVLPWSPVTPAATAADGATDADTTGEGGEGDPQADGLLSMASLKEAATAQASASASGKTAQSADGQAQQAMLDASAPSADAASLDTQSEVASFARLLDGKGGQTDAAGRGESSRTDAQVSALSASSASTQARASSAQATQVPGGALNMQQGEVSEALADRVMWMSSRNLKSAEIQLHPQELGRLEVRIELQQDQTQVSFVSQHAGVRDALESQMGRLREMFQQQGMNLVDVNVSDQSRNWQGQSSNDGRQGGGSGTGSAMGVAGNDDGGSAQVMELNGLSGAVARGLVDFYA